MAIDSAIAEFDSSKMNGKGEKTTSKNIHVNPCNCKTSFFIEFRVF